MRKSLLGFIDSADHRIIKRYHGLTFIKMSPSTGLQGDCAS